MFESGSSVRLHTYHHNQFKQNGWITKWTSEKLKSNLSGIFYRIGDSASRSEGIWEWVLCHTFITRIMVVFHEVGKSTNNEHMFTEHKIVVGSICWDRPMFLFNRIFQFHPQVLHKVVLKECILKPQGGGGRGGRGIPLPHWCWWCLGHVKRQRDNIYKIKMGPFFIFTSLLMHYTGKK